MMHFSYKLGHDFGLAPNPFGKFCTLAVCKGRIRKNKKLAIGSWVFGFGSKKLRCEHKLIFALKVKEKLTFDQYWNNPSFQYKKPVLNGSLVQLYGDNIYHNDENGIWVQENSAHSFENDTNRDHLSSDTDGYHVIVSDFFYYFGDNYINIPEDFNEIECLIRDFKLIPNDRLVQDLVKWLELNYVRGINGTPINWRMYDIPEEFHLR